MCKQDDIYGEDIYGGVSEPTKADVPAHTNNGTLVQAHQVLTVEVVINSSDRPQLVEYLAVVGPRQNRASAWSGWFELTKVCHELFRLLQSMCLLTVLYDRPLALQSSPRGAGNTSAGMQHCKLLTYMGLTGLPDFLSSVLIV